MRLAFCRGHGLVSTIIRWWTWGPYGHVAVELMSGNVIEAWPGKGVHLREPFKPGEPGVQFYCIPGLKRWQELSIQGFLYGQMEKPYDYKGIFNFIPRSGKSPVGFATPRWFCSSVIQAAFDHAGYPLLNVPQRKATPSLLSYSTLLEPCSPECGPHRSCRL